MLQDKTSGEKKDSNRVATCNHVRNVLHAGYSAEKASHGYVARNGTRQKTRQWQDKTVTITDMRKSDADDMKMLAQRSISVRATKKNSR